MSVTVDAKYQSQARNTILIPEYTSGLFKNINWQNLILIGM
jgi:hypothetical protein